MDGAPLSLLSAMIAPVVIINACGLFVLSTSQRLSRQIERVRHLASSTRAAGEPETRRHLEDQLVRTARRVRLLQHSLAAQYISICLFLLTIFAIAFSHLLGGRLLWSPVALALTGVSAFFYASVLLILESRAAISTIRRETAAALRLERR